jgi:polysaccharide deacetylase 2 family uncharacterized protein YibQ
MGRHYRKKDSFMKGLLKLMLLAVLSFALLFAACLLYPDRFSPTAVNMAERITLSAGILRSKIAALFPKDGEISKVIHGTAPKGEKKEVSAAVSEDKAPAVSEEASAPEQPDKRAILAIVIDDGGNDLAMAKKAASLGMPVTWAILPYTRYATETAAVAKGAGIPYLLHLPMQAMIDKDPKEYLVGKGMDRQTIKAITAKALDSLPSPIGINNHRGSLATSDWDTIVPVIDVLRERGLCFMDSRTSDKSVAYKAAQAAGITAFRNMGFLDGTPDKDSIRARFDEVIKTTVKRGNTIVICHFRPATLLFLEDLAGRYRDLPIRLVTLPEMAEILSKDQKVEEEW